MLRINELHEIGIMIMENEAEIIVPDQYYMNVLDEGDNLYHVTLSRATYLELKYIEDLINQTKR